MSTVVQHQREHRSTSTYSGSVHLLVIAKQPVAGRVKTRLCPPATPAQAAAVAAAALADTIAAASLTRADRRTLIVDGHIAPPAGWAVLPQRDGSLGERLATGFADTARPGSISVLIGMDTPQVTPAVLDAIAAQFINDHGLDAVLGPAEDGGWWCLALRSAHHATVLRQVTMSQPDTAVMTLAALRSTGADVAIGPTLRDVDTAADAWAVAAACDPASHFASAVRDLLSSRVAA